MSVRFKSAAAGTRRRVRRGENGPEIAGLRDVSNVTIYPHVFGNADREVGGVLIGRLSGDGGLPLVTGAIPAISANEQKATLTFTQESWAHVHQVLESEFPADEQIVGWYHSHPSFGIFLSGHDLFIHENFFDAPSQIAVVVDPIGCREGAFGWQEGKLAPLYEQATPERWRAPAELQHPPQRRVDEARVVVAADHATLSSTRLLALVAVVSCVLVVIALLLVTGVFGSAGGRSGGTGHGPPQRIHKVGTHQRGPS
jgi:proteasome lid subunit RPN8/RPN11